MCLRAAWPGRGCAREKRVDGALRRPRGRARRQPGAQPGHPPGDIRMSLLFFQSVGMLLRSLPFPAFPLLNSTPCPSARGDAVPGASSCSCAVGPDSSLDRSHRVPAAPASESPQDPQPGRLPLQLPNGNKPLSLGSGDLGMIWSWVG